MSLDQEAIRGYFGAATRRPGTEIETKPQADTTFNVKRRIRAFDP